jgi:hypothetical protein
MPGRADHALEEQLKRTHDEATNKPVKAAIAAALEYMSTGRDRHRRGGRRLVALLETARFHAADANMWHVVRLLQDSLDYAEERILKPDFEERYRLYQDGNRSEISANAVARTAWAAYTYAAESLQEYIDENPDASINGSIEHARSLAQDALYIDAPDDRPGRYRLLRGRAELAVWIERVLRERIDVENPGEAAKRITMSPDALTVLASDTDGQILLRAAEMQRRAAGLTVLRRVAERETATERDLQRALKGQYWIFGGQFVGESIHRRLVEGDEVDIPLVRGDGSMHIVELKRSMSLSRPLVKRHRNAWVPTSQVHDAVSQAVNYLVGLDENRQSIREEFGLDTRRASAIVLIGHPARQPDVPEEAINETLRTLNAHLGRVEVLTYKELIDNAERSLLHPPDQ